MGDECIPAIHYSLGAFQQGGDLPTGHFGWEKRASKPWNLGILPVVFRKFSDWISVKQLCQVNSCHGVFFLNTPKNPATEGHRCQVEQRVVCRALCSGRITEAMDAWGLDGLKQEIHIHRLGRGVPPHLNYNTVIWSDMIHFFCFFWVICCYRPSWT